MEYYTSEKRWGRARARQRSVLKIVILHPQKEVADALSATVKSALIRARCSFELSTYLKNARIIEMLSASPFYYDILLLDAEDDSSLQIANRLREKNLEASLLFVLEKGDAGIVPLLKYRPCGIVADPRVPKNVLAALQTAYQERKRLDSYFTIKTREKIIAVNYRDIDYFENYQKSVTLHSHARRERIVFHATFEDVYSLLPKDVFLKCHQSLIVNLRAVRMLDKVNRQFLLHSGAKADISNRLLSGIAKAYQDYISFNE